MSSVKEINISKVKIKSNGLVYLEGLLKLQGEEEDFKKNYTTRAHPDFRQSFENFSIHAIRILAKDFGVEGLYSDEYQDSHILSQILENVSITSIALAGSGDTEGVVISYSLKSVDGNTNKIVSPTIRMNQETSPYRYADDLARDWEQLEAEALAYYNREKVDTENSVNGQSSIFDEDIMSEESVEMV